MTQAAAPAMAGETLFRAVGARYAGVSRFAQGYVRSKLRRDPATGAILGLAAREGFGALLDLGCGRGQMALALLLSGGAAEVTGLDLDASKIAEARQAAWGLEAGFRVADLAAIGQSGAVLPPADTVLMVDLLYQMPEAAQHALLVAAAGAARRRVVIRAFDPALGWRSGAGFAMEWLNRAARGAWRASIRPLPLDEMVRPLEAAGFRVTTGPCWAGTPLPNVLLLAEKTAA